MEGGILQKSHVKLYLYELVGQRVELYVGRGISQSEDPNSGPFEHQTHNNHSNNNTI